MTPALEAAARRTAEDVYEILTSEDEGRVCRDIPDSACKDQPRNFLTHALSLTLTKSGDALVDPKLVLAWLLGALGAPASAAGMLVPVRESLALLPQLATAGVIRKMARRKWVWVFGSLVQGSCVIAMAGVAATMEGAAAGWLIVALLALFALGRSLCSVSYKDVLGKTISKGRRGTATGTASSVASAAALALGAAFASGLVPLNVTTISVVLLIGGGFWIAAAALFSTLPEEPGATEGGGSALRVAREQAFLLREDPQLVRFIVTRGLLMGTALAPPYLLAMAGAREGAALDSLGPFLLASALAGMASTYVWGRLADRSSRGVLIISGLAAALVLGAACLAQASGMAWAESTLAFAGVLFGLMIAYKGVRLGRSTHVTDMADEDTRAAYTALSNTIVGLLLALGGLFGLIADQWGPTAVIGIFAAMSLAAAVIAWGLEDVQAQ